MSEELNDAIQTFNTKISEALKRAVAKDTATPILRLFLKDRTLKGDVTPQKKRPGKDFIDSLNKLQSDKTAQTIKENFEKIEGKMFEKTGEANEKNIDWTEVKRNPNTYAKVCKNTINGIKDFISVDDIKQLEGLDIKKLLKNLFKCIAQIKILQKEENLKSKSNSKVNENISDAINSIMNIKSKNVLEEFKRAYAGTTDSLSNVENLHKYLTSLLGYKDIEKDLNDVKNYKNKPHRLSRFIKSYSKKVRTLIKDSNTISQTQKEALCQKIEKLLDGNTKYITMSDEKINESKKARKEKQAKALEKLSGLKTIWNNINHKYKKSLKKLAGKYKSAEQSKDKQYILDEALQLIMNGRVSLDGSIDKDKLIYFVHCYKNGYLDKNPFFSKVLYDESVLKPVLKEYGLNLEGNTIK